MQLQTILNRVERYKSFVHKKIMWDENEACPTLQVEIEHRANGQPIFSGFGRDMIGLRRAVGICALAADKSCVSCCNTTSVLYMVTCYGRIFQRFWE